MNVTTSNCATSKSVSEGERFTRLASWTLRSVLTDLASVVDFIANSPLRVLCDLLFKKVLIGTEGRRGHEVRRPRN